MATQALPTLPIQANVLEVEQVLHYFDTASSVGPLLSSTRFDLLARLRKNTAVDKWEWVVDTPAAPCPPAPEARRTIP